MTQKSTDLSKNLAKKLGQQVKGPKNPNRFGQAPVDQPGKEAKPSSILSQLLKRQMT
ncbi:MAG: hypothetical protein QE278_13355 [Limnobacter sp.]|nr:hypothetical protein [Limnobacter sp.]